MEYWLTMSAGILGWMKALTIIMSRGVITKLNQLVTKELDLGEKVEMASLQMLEKALLVFFNWNIYIAPGKMMTSRYPIPRKSLTRKTTEPSFMEKPHLCSII